MSHNPNKNSTPTSLPNHIVQGISYLFPAQFFTFHVQTLPLHDLIDEKKKAEASTQKPHENVLKH
jgi:hypothetical protein